MQRNDGNDVRDEGRGRTAKKREAKAVELLAQRLTEITDSELSKLPKTPELKNEIDLARNTSGFSSRKRQIKHLASVLRRHDEQRAAIEEALDGQAVSLRQASMAFHNLEGLRDRRCAAATFVEALAEVQTTYPHLDSGKLTRLAGSVHEHSDKRAAREVFQLLRKAEETREI
jgi:ribosome-associated protein